MDRLVIHYVDGHEQEFTKETALGGMGWVVSHMFDERIASVTLETGWERTPGGVTHPRDGEYLVITADGYGYIEAHDLDDALIAGRSE